MKTNTPLSYIIAAPRSNSGKTIITLGLIRALAKKGLKVQPFKCGPDYIDTMHHTKISGCKSYNLDNWMSSDMHVKELFHSRCKGSDVAIIEGVMGLFDGANKDEGSTAELARLLDVPVILVIDASSMAYSVAPLLFGYKNFDRRVKFAGVIFNKVGSKSHYNYLKQAAFDVGIPSLGYLLKDKELHVESRHLGLHLPNEINISSLVERVAKQIVSNVCIDSLLSQNGKGIIPLEHAFIKSERKLCVGIAHDEAFNFSYQANLDSLNHIAKVITFSPISDKKLPECDLLWIPGGYPELFAEELSRNVEIAHAIKNHIESDNALIAECGGMMYLGQLLIDKTGKKHKMSGIFTYSTSMLNSQLHLGYRKIKFDSSEIKGHEFHYSELIDSDGDCIYNVVNAKDQQIEMPVFRYRNTWASYMHLYLGEQNVLKAFLKHLNVRIG